MSKKLKMKRSLNSTSAVGTLPQITIHDMKETSLKLNLFCYSSVIFLTWADVFQQCTISLPTDFAAHWCSHNWQLFSSS